MLYRVTCADRDTGSPYTVDVEAERPDLAVKLAADQGHIASSAVLAPVAPADTVVHELLRQIRDEQMLQRLATQRIAVSRLVRAPIGTISTAVLIAMILWTLLFGSGYLFLAFKAEDARQQRLRELGR